MDAEKFEEVFEHQVDLCRRLLLQKGAEYAENTDRLKNFRISAAMTQCTEKQALAGMMVKHTTSLYDMIACDGNFVMASWDEKITDHMNYLFLLRALIVEDKEADLGMDVV